MRAGSFENREGMLVSALVVALIVAAVSLMSAAEVFAQVILDPDFELEEIAYDPVTLTRTFKVSFPATGVDGLFLTIELSGDLEEHALLDPRGLYLFNMDAAGLEGDLNTGVVSEELKEAFYEAKGIALSESDAIVILERGRKWNIIPSVIGQGYYILPQKILGNSPVLIYPTSLILPPERIASFIFFSSLRHAVKACSKCSKVSKNSLWVTLSRIHFQRGSLALSSGE